MAITAVQRIYQKRLLHLCINICVYNNTAISNLDIKLHIKKKKKIAHTLLHINAIARTAHDCCVSPFTRGGGGTNPFLLMNLKDVYTICIWQYVPLVSCKYLALM